MLFRAQIYNGVSNNEWWFNRVTKLGRSDRKFGNGSGNDQKSVTSQHANPTYLQFGTYIIHIDTQSYIII